MTPFQNPYEQDIKKIKRRIRWTAMITLVIDLVILLVGNPITIELLGYSYVDYRGLPLWVSLFLLSLTLILSFFINAVFLSATETAMTEDGDPQKYLALKTEFYKNNRKHMNSVYAVALFYMGDYGNALAYANALAMQTKPVMALDGRYYQALCCFFMQNGQGLEVALAEYRRLLPTLTGNKKVKEMCYGMGNLLELMWAISKGDQEGMKSYKTLTPWQKGLHTVALTHYLQGMAAYALGHREDATYHFRFVKEECPKIVLAKYAQTYLDNIAHLR